jgi:hypothetical protein
MYKPSTMAGIKNVNVPTSAIDEYVKTLEDGTFVYSSDLHGYISMAPKEAKFISELKTTGMMKMGMRKDGMWEVKTVMAEGAF